jgi:hypothetical protein
MMVVKHHWKSVKVKAHLNSCREFRRKMADLPSTAKFKRNTKRKWANPAPQAAPPADILCDVVSTQASKSSTIASSPLLMRFLTPTAAATVATTTRRTNNGQ